VLVSASEYKFEVIGSPQHAVGPQHPSAADGDDSLMAAAIAPYFSFTAF
jgi:hypothetical protein